MLKLLVTYGILKVQESFDDDDDNNNNNNNSNGEMQMRRKGKS